MARGRRRHKKAAGPIRPSLTGMLFQCGDLRFGALDGSSVSDIDGSKAMSPWALGCHRPGIIVVTFLTPAESFSKDR